MECGYPFHKDFFLVQTSDSGQQRKVILAQAFHMKNEVKVFDVYIIYVGT